MDMTNMVDMVDVSFVDKFNALGGALVVFASYIFGEHWMLFAAFLALNLIDFITGLAKSKILKTESSNAGLKGIVKKFMYWCMIAVSFLMTPLFNEIGEAIDVDVTAFTPLIGYMVLAMLIINEFRSVLENLVESGVNVPPIMIKGFAIFEKLVVAKEDRFFDGQLDVTKNGDDHYHVNISTPVEEIEKKDSVTLRIRTVDDEED